MPAFDTPAPITATLEFEVASIRITAGKRAETVVEVQPQDTTRDADIQAAEQTKVGYADGRLTVKGPKKRSLFGKPGMLDVRVELPAGSKIDGVTALGNVTCAGLLGDCRLKTSLGDLHVEDAAQVRLKTSHGDIRLDRASGDAEVSGAGRIEIGEVAGATTVENANGDIEVGEAVGELRAKSANGRISVNVAHSGVDARSANGAIRVHEVASGRIALRTAVGDLEVGIPESTAAWLDAQTQFGQVRNSLGPAQGPGTSTRTVEVHARTSYGDVVIRRA
ncbi:DUF4097 family beta strand repeat-containing protein [Streptomyces sp. SAJ15]|uniref:DUF4097 family beta strand repeat-containing protein n=1 Tax=Streptomyces sp. SAJ15 TaxID=2011095 RepID=UPI00118518F4|nr:DUF4097 family beta strand repeat-containing protein [Streptomyces sp. SAJ15]TVL89150.1 hypothetical protein CD790_28615 [Streptomyces sp. SAJ15]